MKLTVEYNKLINSLTYVGSVSNSTMSLEANRTVVFVVTDNQISIYGESATIGAITDIEKGDYKYETDKEERKDAFQVKTKEFLNFLNTFTVDRTYPTDVVFSINEAETELTLSVYEEPLEDQPSYLSNKSDWTFNLSRLKESTLKSMVISEGEDVVPSELLQIYVDAFFPLLNNQEASMSDSKVNFGEEYVYVNTSRTFALFNNKLPECMKGIVLGYAGIQLLKQLSSEHEQLFVSLNDKESRLFVTVENNRFAIKFNRKMPPYQSILNAIAYDNHFTVDRKMLTSVIKRLKLVNDTTKVQVNLGSNQLDVGNSKFHQSLPLTDYAGEVIGDFKIDVVTDILSDAIIGDDAMFSDEVTFVVTPSNNSYMICVKDESSNWLSMFRVIAK